MDKGREPSGIALTACDLCHYLDHTDRYGGLSAGALPDHMVHGSELMIILHIWRHQD